MSDDVNEYGLGASNTQAEASSETHGQRTDPLAHGLGARGEQHDQHGDEDIAEGGRHNRLEHGLGGAGFPDANVAPGATQPDPLRHGLGTPDAGHEGGAAQ